MNRHEIDTVKSALQARGREVSAGDVALALADIDVEAITNSANARVEWEVWDKETPINGVEPSYFLNREDYGGGEVFLVKMDGRVVMVQPHVPNVSGVEPIRQHEVESMATQQAGDLADNLVLSQVVDAVDAAIPVVTPDPTDETEVAQSEQMQASHARRKPPSQL